MFETVNDLLSIYTIIAIICVFLFYGLYLTFESYKNQHFSNFFNHLANYQDDTNE